MHLRTPQLRSNGALLNFVFSLPRLRGWDLKYINAWVQIVEHPDFLVSFQFYLFHFFTEDPKGVLRPDTNSSDRHYPTVHAAIKRTGGKKKSQSWSLNFFVRHFRLCCTYFNGYYVELRYSEIRCFYSTRRFKVELFEVHLEWNIKAPFAQVVYVFWKTLSKPALLFKYLAHEMRKK